MEKLREHVNTVTTYTNVFGDLYFQLSYEKMTTDDFSNYSESEMETVPVGFCRRLPKHYRSDQRQVSNTDSMDSRLCWIGAGFDNK